jgi:hypothetical protein
MASGLQAMIDETKSELGEIHAGVYQAFIAYPIQAALET